MGNACQCQQVGSEHNEIVSARPDFKEKKTETITIPQSGTNSKKQTQKDNYDEEDEQVEDPQISQMDREPKRNDKKKKANINAVSDTQEITENVTIVKDKKKSPFDYQLILNAFNEHFIFKSVQPSDKEYIVEKMFYCTVQDGQFVFKQGDKASTYFLIERGQCQIVINGDLKKTLKNAEAFGELALLYNAARSASVKAVGDCAFWAIDRNTFRKVVETQNLKDYEENRKFIQEVKFFEQLTEEQKNSISSVLITLVFKKGEMIVNEGDMANSFFIIKKGKVGIFKGEKELKQMSPGESFGEQALFNNAVRAASVKAIDEEVRCLALAREDITRILGQNIQKMMYLNVQKWALEKNKLLGKLTPIQIEKLVQKSRQVHYQKDEIIVKAHSQITKLYIVLEGEIISVPSNKVVSEKGHLYGEQYAQANIKKEVPENLVMKGDGIMAEIELKVFLEVIGGTLEQILLKNEKYHEHYMNRPSALLKMDFSHIKLESLISIKKLGQGQFGNVYLVKNPTEDRFYALKCISKAQIIDQHLERHLSQEKQVLTAVNFPFLMQFYRSFRDNNYIYFLVEYIRGMELFDVIREIGLLNVFESHFYIGTLLLCVEYLHKQNIIYRDIKPENLMVDDKGFLRMIDMGTAKYLNQKGARTYTIIGTPHYMAPEIITGKGYTFSVDLWSVGVCLYEFMCGGVPYAEDADDPYEIYEEITKKSLQFPSFLKDRKSKKIIEQMLSKTPELRLGGSYAALKANPWFDTFDWDKLMDRDMKSPYVPKKTKIISEKEMQQALQAGKLACKEVNSLGAAYKKEKAKDPNWDKDY